MEGHRMLEHLLVQWEPLPNYYWNNMAELGHLQNSKLTGSKTTLTLDLSQKVEKKISKTTFIQEAMFVKSQAPSNKNLQPQIQQQLPS